MNYTAVVFVPKDSLVTLHGTARILGANTISLDGLDTLGQQTGPLYNYLVGVAVPAAVMIFIFIIYLFSLCCIRCCCKQKLHKNACMGMFVLSCLISILGWILGLVGNYNASAGFNAMIGGVMAIKGLGLDVIRLSARTKTLNLELNRLANEMNVPCNELQANFSFPLVEVVSAINQAIAQVDQGAGSVVGLIQGFINQTDAVLVQVNTYLQWRETGFLIVLVILIVILSFFLMTTFFRETEKSPKCLEKTCRRSAKTSSCFLFVFGLLFLLIVWIFVALIHVLLTVGADFCIPSPDYNLNRLLAPILFQYTTTTNSPCTEPGFVNSQIGGAICYYQSCSGQSPLADMTQNIGDFTSTSANLITDFRNQINQIANVTNVTSLEQVCFFLRGEEKKTDKHKKKVLFSSRYLLCFCWGN